MSQLVTVPVLDSRLQELRHELTKMQVHLSSELGEMRLEMEKMRTELRTDLERVRADLVRWVFLTMLGSVALSASASTALKLLAN